MSSLSVTMSLPLDVALQPARSRPSDAVKSLVPHVRVVASGLENSYVITTSPGIMINSMDFSESLAAEIETALNGHPALMLITHGDDTADHQQWKQRFPGLRRIIHEADVRTEREWPGVDTRDVEVKLSAADFTFPADDRLGRCELAPGVHVLSTPGHTRGSLCVLAEEVATGGATCVFTGDHMTARPELGRIDGYAQFGQDVVAQADSMAKLAREEFTLLAPGHLAQVHFANAHECSTEIGRAAAQFADDPFGRG